MVHIKFGCFLLWAIYIISTSWSSEFYPLKQFKLAPFYESVQITDQLSKTDGGFTGAGLHVRLRWEERIQNKFSVGVRYNYKYADYSSPDKFKASNLIQNDFRIFIFAACLVNDWLKFFGGAQWTDVPFFTATDTSDGKLQGVQEWGLHGGALVLLPETFARTNVFMIQMAKNLIHPKVRSQTIKNSQWLSMEIQSTVGGQGPYLGVDFRQASWGDLEQGFFTMRAGITKRF